MKRALLKREIRIEAVAEQLGMSATVQLEPEPVPLDVKVVLIGTREVCALLQAFDDEFDELFRVVADLGDDLPRDDATVGALAAALAARARASGLLAPEPAALAACIDHAARLSEDRERLSAQVRRLLDVLHEADHWRGSARPP
ncbi:AAA family ATPase [Piscinibacter aquaticus]|uniref:AAA family ATPase n=1 Tax=Piscinibacter aquaticus TaxID=392597 RepID=A0A5C6U725_9BURK|nr:AAA family ATPase [Piscinibacter aquaticus]